jgi:hypothetical protein
VEALGDRRTPNVPFAGQQTYSDGTEFFAVAVENFNGHGRLDIADANYFGGPLVLLNTTAPKAAMHTFAAQDLRGRRRPLGHRAGERRPETSLSEVKQRD